MRIVINNNSMVPIYEQICEQIKGEIFAGELKEGDALPSVRALAAELRISALTVKKAYDILEKDAFVTTVHGKGTFINAADHPLAYEAKRKAAEDELGRALKKALAYGLSKEELLEAVELILEDEK